MSQIASQGWSLIPTWVEPQAPCSSFPSKISSNTSTADSQGRAEADSAISVMQNWGFSTPTIVYYDIEGYDTSNQSCIQAVNSFLSAWDDRMQNYWHSVAGIYGSSCGSGASTWAGMAHVPDDVWLADWNNSASTLGISCVSNGLWSSDQRIHQYIGDHNETYGGITFNIDTNCLDGRTVANTWGAAGSKNC